jgi:predicted amidohydrolase/diadenosine tetraphosphate (Ap4A) HIT family hydrolase
MRSTNDKLHNRNQVKKLFENSKGNANFLFLPEGIDFIGKSADETLALSEPLDGETVQFYKHLCKSHKIAASFGGIHEKLINSTSNKISNTHIVISSDGEIIGVYRKLHLFDVDTPEFKFRESKVVEAGKFIAPVVNTNVGRIGLQICYDIRFPEASIWLKSHHAQIITFPSAFSMTTGKLHWEILNRCRAIENQCFVISAAQQGAHNEKRSSYGNAIAVDPLGNILAQCTKELEVQFVEIDLDKIASVERNMPCFSHRRPDVYALDFKVQPPTDFTDSFVFEKYPIDKNTIFYETEYCVAFVNIRCVVPGHVLVATKKKVPRIDDLTEIEQKDLFSSACKIGKVLDNYYNATSRTMTIQDGEHSGQTVKHCHCHIMPRKEGDFENNDQIYEELNKHDHNPQDKRRDLKEMIAEAEIYKKLLQNN